MSIPLCKMLESDAGVLFNQADDAWRQIFLRMQQLMQGEVRRTLGLVGKVPSGGNPEFEDTWPDLRPDDGIGGCCREIQPRNRGADHRPPLGRGIAEAAGEDELPFNAVDRAPVQKERTTVDLEMRSKCCAAKKDLASKTVEQFHAVSTSADEFSFSRAVCDPGRQFAINGSGGVGNQPSSPSRHPDRSRVCTP